MWKVYSKIRELVEKSEDENALAEIARVRAECVSKRFSPLLVLEALCIAKKQNLQNYLHAVEILREAAQLEPGNFWAFYNLGHYLRKIGQPRQALAAIWESHRLVEGRRAAARVTSSPMTTSPQISQDGGNGSPR